jgi:subtilisin family serine protease
MKRKLLFVLLLFSVNLIYAGGLTYFIKYKNSVEKTVVENKISQQQISTSLKKNTFPYSYSVKHFAKNLASDDESLSRIVKVTFASQQAADEYLSELRSDNSVEYVQQSVVYKVESVPNDSLINQQWALAKIGAFDAWNITTGSDKILLAIIDTGIEFFHPDLKNNIYFNPGEMGIDKNGNDKATNNIDDDGNGFVDDYMGWDFTDRTSLPEDSTVDIHNWDNYPYDPVRGTSGYHGTAVAGIACAVSGNTTGIAGVAPGIKMLNLRAFDNTGNGEDDDVAAAVLYAVKMNARIINMSFGDTKFSYVLRDVIRYAYSKNVVLVASSGNSNNDEAHYPSGYEEVISVGNSTKDDSYTGTYGSTLDMVAPGTSVLSTTMNGGYSEFSGTSAAAPHVSAAAALVLSVNNNFSNEEVKQILKSTSDDIGTGGWDIRTGAGRLNLNKALSVLSPAKIKFNYPFQDFATFQDSININITAVSPYFSSYSIEYGSGITPDTWTTIISNGGYQVLNENAASLNIKSLPDGDYTLKLSVLLNNGGTTEERINFHIQRQAPQIVLVGSGPVYIGKTSTIMGELLTNTIAVTRMYFRQKGSNSDFNFITLDGSAPNTQFVKKQHYGFIPENLVQPNTVYEVYFEAENLAGLKSILKDNNNYFEYSTDPAEIQSSVSQMPYSLPSGNLFEKPVNFLSDRGNEVLFSDYSDKHDSVNIQYKLLTLEDNNFTAMGILNNQIPVSAGDFNKNGKTNLLSRSFPDAYISEQQQAGSFILTEKTKKDTSYFYPVLAADLNNDGRPEIISNHYKTSTKIFRINDDLSLDSIGIIKNTSLNSADYTGQEYYNVSFKNSFAAADVDGDGIKELCLLDYDGDLYTYKFNNNVITPGDSLIENTLTIGENKIITSGDYNGDGSDEVAVLYNSGGIANYFVLRIISFKNHQANILFEKVFVDQSADYSGIFSESFQSLKMTDIDDDGKAELIVNIFPDVYIFKYINNGSRLVYFDEGISSEAIFCGDLNQNGVPEIGLQYAAGYKFFEFTSGLKPAVPGNFQAYSTDSTHIYLHWTGTADKYLLYKGLTDKSLEFLDSTAAAYYIDSDAEPGKYYYYAVKQIDYSQKIPESDLSKILEVYSHTPAVAIKPESRGDGHVLISFSDKINNTIDNPDAFEIIGIGVPNSISAASQYSYLISYNNLPAGKYQLIVKGLKDYYGSFIKQDTLTFEVFPLENQSEFYISSYNIKDPYTIYISFNLEVNENDVLNTSNYQFEPENHVASVSVDQANKKTICLNLLRERPVGSIGKEYRLKLNNISSSGGIKINESAGSYIVLTGCTENLSGVYVYPSPAKISGGNGKMMFANLPRRVNITVLSLEGRKLFSLEERDGNGGVEYNLKDDDNKTLNSGVYLYRIVRLDDNNNEVEEKIGKFTVIR